MNGAPIDAPAATETHAVKFTSVLAAECERIAQHRVRRGASPDQPPIGVALSGGGIRSASFGMGVLQALAARGRLRDVDYLSTVSGGGYAGTALTWWRRHGATEFPFAGDGPDTPLDRLRRQVGYLSPTRHLSLAALAAVVLQQAVFSVIVYGGLLVAAFFALDIIDQALHPVRAVAALAARGPWKRWALLNANAALVVAAVCALLLVGQAFAPGLRRLLRWGRPWDAARVRKAYLRRRKAMRCGGALLRLGVAAFVIGTVPPVSSAFAQVVDEATVRGTALAVAIALLAAGLAWSRRLASAGVLAQMLAFAVLYGLLLLAHTIANGLVMSAAPWLVWVLLGVALVFGATTPLDAYGSQAVYRDRLSEAFMPDDAAVDDPRGRPAREAATHPLAAACGPDTAGPYHLLNAALLTTDSPLGRRRERGADAFLLSPLYCGSDATGWRETAPPSAGGMTLASAMATSAAAVDPHAAAAGHDVTRGSLVSILLAVLGLRLGRVVRNPARLPPSRGHRLPPNLLAPGIPAMLLGELTEGGRWLTLADGGDFDDLGVYELLRRRAAVIVAVDATEDPDHTCAALGTLVELARTDLGVAITIDGLDRLRPPAASAEPATQAHALGRIAYPAAGGLPANDGVLLYLKATMLAGVPADVAAHVRLHPVFPHDCAIDQFFDEGTFDAYRLLGRLAGERMLDDVAVANVLP